MVHVLQRMCVDNVGAGGKEKNVLRRKFKQRALSERQWPIAELSVNSFLCCPSLGGSRGACRLVRQETKLQKAFVSASFCLQLTLSNMLQDSGKIYSFLT